MGKIIIVGSGEFEELKDKKNVEIAGFVRNIKLHPREIKKWDKEKKEEKEK